MSNNVVKHKTGDERLAALARSASNVAVLKFISGNWTISDTPVSQETKFTIFPAQVQHAWTCFREGKVAEEISAIVVDDDDGDPTERIVRGRGRSDLGDIDEALWPVDKASKRQDPWAYGFSLPMVNVDTGTMVVFRTASVGGRGAVAEQVGNFQRNRQLGNPIVQLASSSYKNRKFGGFTIVPVLRVVGYDTPKAPGAAVGSGNGGGGSNGDGARVIGETKVRDREVDDMDDDIPF
jgi:hypothetical protein